nr:MAG TPA: hypothetical protein [Caudoviricetes sp.]
MFATNHCVTISHLQSLQYAIFDNCLLLFLLPLQYFYKSMMDNC